MNGRPVQVRKSNRKEDAISNPTPTLASGRVDPIEQIAKFARTASFETTRLTEADLAAVKTSAPPRCAIYVSAIPSRPLAEQVVTATQLRDAGFEPVAHLAARNFSSLAALEEHLNLLVGQAKVKQVLVIAGDRPDAAGPLRDALALIKTGAVQGCGITDIGISAYPEGHPTISDADLARALSEKLEAAAAAGLNVRIVTQFTMSTPPITSLIEGLRARGVQAPISIGLAGPTSMTTLLKFARLCGVKTSVRGLARNAGLLKNLVGVATADPVVRALAEHQPRLGAINPHFFSFGGLPATTRWAGAVAAGRITLRKDGFDVQPS